MTEILNKKSGLLGVSGISSDMREIIEARKSGNSDAKLAFDMFSDRIRKYIAQYFAVLNGADAVVFTAGIGENSNWVRSEIINQMTWFGMAIDEVKNVARAKGIISTEDSKVKVLVIPTDEELMIVREVDLSKKAIEIYQETLSLSSDSTFLFTTSNNTPIQINALNAYLRAHKEEMGFDRNRTISTHIFRHTHISKLAEIGVPLHVIQRRVGHASEKITREIYLHITNKMKSDTKDLLELL